MTRPSPFSVRGRRALMVMRDEREISIVRRQLNRLGMTISEHDPNEASPPDEAFDVIVLDADTIPIKSDLATSKALPSGSWASANVCATAAQAPFMSGCSHGIATCSPRT